MEISRREFLKLLGIGSAAATAGVWSAHSLLYVPDQVLERIRQGARIETWKHSVCSLCPGGCGVRVRLLDGIPVRIQGNSNYPVNLGAICPLGEAGLDYLFHPQRIKAPLKRTGWRGANSWKSISWEEALEILTGRISNLLKNNSPEKLVVLGHAKNTLSDTLITRFLQAVGSPNHLLSGPGDIFAIPARMAQGWPEAPAYDMSNADLILNFGADLLDDEIAPVYYNRLYAESQARIIHCSSYQSRTAARSSKWIPVLPGSSGALALGIANVIIRDGTYDRRFIDQHTFGFGEWKDPRGVRHEGFQDLVREHYAPEKVAEICGVAPDIIVEIARDFASTGSALAIAGRQTVEATNGAYTQYAVYALNTLKGNFEKKGGVFFPSRSDLFQAGPSSLPDAGKMDTGSTIAAANLHQLLTGLHDHGPDFVDTLVLHNSNPVFTTGREASVQEAFSRIPYIISTSTFLDESAALADLVLPEPSWLECWDASLFVPTLNFLHFGVQQPVLEPIYDNRQTGAVLLEVAGKLGPEISRQLPWKTLPEFLHGYGNTIYQSGQGTLLTEEVDFAWVAYLKSRGWQAFEYSSFEEFWNLLLEKGGWWNPEYTPKSNLVYKNRTGKFEFFSTTLETGLERFRLPADSRDPDLENRFGSLHIKARGDTIFFPHYEELYFKTGGPKYPFILIPFPNWATTHSGPVLGLTQELAGIYTHEYWKPWVEINPAVAERLGIRENDRLEIISPAGALPVRAKLRPTVMPETIVVPMGRFPGTVEMNPQSLFEPETDRISGMPSPISTRVQIRKIKSERLG